MTHDLPPGPGSEQLGGRLPRLLCLLTLSHGLDCVRKLSDPDEDVKEIDGTGMTASIARTV